jgi:hypothetical protein
MRSVSASRASTLLRPACSSARISLGLPSAHLAGPPEQHQHGRLGQDRHGVHERPAPGAERVVDAGGLGGHHPVLQQHEADAST